MEPLTALGLAGNLVQFVQFSSSLIHSSMEIYQSAFGATADVLTIESIYKQLQSFHEELIVSRNNAKTYLAGPGAKAAQGTIPFQALSNLCYADYKKLLEMVRQLKTQNNPGRRW